MTHTIEALLILGTMAVTVFAVIGWIALVERWAPLWSWRFPVIAFGIPCALFVLGSIAWDLSS